MKLRFARLLAATAFLVVAAVPAGAATPSPKDCGTVLAALPVGTSSCPGVRPGALFFMENGNGCSMSFVFRGSDGRDYVGTGGHCIWATSNVGPSAKKEARWGPGEGGAVDDPDGRRLGRFAYGVWNDNRDFALIRLDPGVRPNPSMCYFGGPRSMYTEHTGGPVFLKHFGNGMVIGEVVPARTAVAFDTRDQYTVYAYSASTFGDSGSGAMTTDGRAVGTLVTLHVDGTTGITRLDDSIERAQQFTGLKFTLRTAAL